MSLYILPTAEIVQRYQKFNDLFRFYDEGVRGLIRDIILTTDITDPKINNGLDSDIYAKVVWDYEHCPEYRNLEMSYPNDQASVTIEFIFLAMHYDIQVMLTSVFVNNLYDLSAQEYDWVGNDLIAKVRFSMRW